MSGVILIDGGFSTQLAQHVKEPIDGHPLWTARFLLQDSQACISAHKSFIRAGSTIIRTNTYQASKDGFVEHLGLNEEQALNLIKNSILFCRESISEEEHPDGAVVQVAGSIGPFGAHLGDGSEYSGSYSKNMAKSEFQNWHRWIMKALVEGGVDLLAIETIPCLPEALAIIELLKEFPETKAWISFTAKSDTEISSGENFAEAAAVCWTAGKGQLLAVGINCSDPAYITPLFRQLRNKNADIPFIAYPNSGEKYDVVHKKWIEEGNKKLSYYVEEWLDMGITYVGGCCRNSASDIAEIGRIIRNWENRIC